MKPASIPVLATSLLAVLLTAACSVDSDERSSEPAPPEPPAGRPVADCDVPSTSDLSDRFWGMHVSEPIGDAFPDAPIGSVNLTTAQVYWRQVETVPGQYDFSRLDSIVETSDERGAKPMLVLGSTPTFHSSQPESAAPQAAMPDVSAWISWVTAVVDRYGDRVDYQIWPEPNIAGNWNGAPEQMAQLTVAAGEVIEESAPEATVVAPATALRLPSQLEWTDRFWATEVDGVPVGDAVDVAAVDPFPMQEGTPEDSLALLCEAQQILSDNAVDVPIWTNEINYGVPNGGNATDVTHYPDDRQAATVARTYLLQAGLGLERVYWLGWGSYPGMAVELSRDGATTSAGEAYAVVHDWLAGRPRPACRVDGGTYTCRIAHGDGLIDVLWRTSGTASVPAPEGATELETVSGDRRAVAPGEQVRIGTSPVAVHRTR